MSSNGKRYNKEFKEDILRLIQEEGRSISSVAKDFGVNQQTIRTWMKRAESKKNPEQATIEELKAQLKAEQRKNKDLETTVDILKKATAIFAKDDQK